MSDSVEVHELPRCDVHWFGANVALPALYDAKTRRGPWANMCEDCFAIHGVGLGTGLGQRLVLRA